jgi:hypothetical protein
MTQDEIIEMAEQAGAIHYWHLSKLEAFAKLVAAKEREKCWMAVVQVAESNGNAYDCVDAILDLESKA